MIDNAGAVVVTGATGMQGRPIVAALRAKGYDVKALSREATTHEPDGGGRRVRGDLSDQNSLYLALEGADAMVVVLPLIFDEEAISLYARNLTEAAQRANVRRIVFNTSAPVPPEAVGVAAVDTKRAAERVFCEAGLDLTVIRPTIYMGNLAAPWTAPAIVNERIIAYPLAANVSCAWITWEDVADCVAAILDDPTTVGETYDVAGPEALDGDGVATAFEVARGAPHTYFAVPLDRFEAGLSKALGSDAGREIAALYRWFNTDGASYLSPGGKGAAALGVVPTQMRNWAARAPWERIVG